MEWTQDAVLKLIDAWIEFPCLYNTQDKLYSNKHARYDALCKLAEIIKSNVPQATAEDVKIKINYLRGQYVNALAKIKGTTKSGAGTDDVCEPSTYWFARLGFLKKHLKRRKSSSNIENVIQTL